MCALVFILLIFRDSRLELPLGWLEEAENEDASLLGADARRDVFAEDEKLLMFIPYSVSGFHNFLLLDDEGGDGIKDFFREVFFESANVDVFSDMREYSGETNRVARGDFLSVRELGEMDSLPGSWSGSVYAGDVAISSHGGFLSGSEKRTVPTFGYSLFSVKYLDLSS